MSRMSSSQVLPRPFLKWAGGKRQLLADLLRCMDKIEAFGRYHEPFVGGGALYFELSRLKRLGRRQAYLSDDNPRLIAAYQGIQQDVTRLIALLAAHKKTHCESYYYDVRAHVPDELIAQAARIIYLNRTCYNGLFRENSQGGFNVPFGRYKNPRICDHENLHAVAQALKKARVGARPFESVLKHAEPGDFVYFDPPYHPVSKTASFTSYAKGGFGEAAQRRLAEVFGQLSEKGVKVLLSNSKTDFIQELYCGQGYVLEEVLANRRVNSRSDRRGKVSEFLIRNF